MTPVPRSAYHPPKLSPLLSTPKVLAFLESRVSGTSDPAVNAAYNDIAHEIEMGRLDP